jgi:hypothetical protein
MAGRNAHAYDTVLLGFNVPLVLMYASLAAVTAAGERSHTLRAVPPSSRWMRDALVVATSLK